MEWEEDLGAYTFPCPCGDLFQITVEVRFGQCIALILHVSVRALQEGVMLVQG